MPVVTSCELGRIRTDGTAIMFAVSPSVNLTKVLSWIYFSQKASGDEELCQC